MLLEVRLKRDDFWPQRGDWEADSAVSDFTFRLYPELVFMTRNS